MAVKITEWRLKMSENVGSILGKLNSAADKTASKLGGVQDKLNGSKFSSFANEVPQASRAMDLFANKYTLAGAAVAAAGAIMYKSAEAGLEFEKGMAKINGTSQLAAPELASLRHELQTIGEHSGGNYDRIPAAFEKINSSINNTTESLDILKIANKGAMAGFTDIDIVAGAEAQIKSILGMRASAESIMDTMMGGKKAGNAEFTDFATYLPQLIASGDNLNINYKDIAGLFSFMTTKNSASDSSMLLQNAFTAMGKSEIQQGFAKQGLHLFDKEGNMRDLGVFFSELKTKLSKFNAESKSNWLEAVGLKDSQAKNAFAVLAGDAEKLNSILSDVRNSTGELNKQLEFTENKSRSWAEIGDQIKSWMVDLSDFLLPIADKIVKGAPNVGRFVTGKDPVQTDIYKEIDKLKYDEKLAKEYAQSEMVRRFSMGPAMFENNNAKMTPAQKEEYNKSYHIMEAKLTGRFGGDYEKWVSEERKKLKDEQDRKAQKKENFSLEKNNNKKPQKNIREGIDGVSQGGQRIINIQFGKLNENIIIQPQTLTEGTNQVVQMSEDMLVRILEGAETSVANE